MKKYKKLTLYPNKYSIVERDKRIFDNVIKFTSCKAKNNFTIYQRFTSNKAKVIVKTQLHLDAIAEVKEERVKLYE